MHILIINPNSDFFTNPTLTYLLNELAKNKATAVTLVIDKQVVAPPKKFVQLLLNDFSHFNVTWPKKFWKWFPVIWDYIKLLRYCKKNKVTKIIGIDPVGLIIGGRLKKLLKKTELHYLSFEIFFMNELTDNKTVKKLKLKEINYSKQVDVLIIQDEVRKQLLLLENKLDKKQLKVFFMPVAPISYMAPNHNRKYYREHLGIQLHETVLLHSGSVAKWSGGDILLALLKLGLPESHKLLIHSKYALNANDELHLQFLEMQKLGYPIVLHDASFPDYEDYFDFMQCADYGLALYQPDFNSPYTGKNIEEIGLASGKFSCYMSQGLPTLTTPSAYFSQLNATYGFGAVVKHAKDIKRCLLSNELQKVKKEACIQLYNEKLNPEYYAGEYFRMLTN